MSDESNVAKGTDYELFVQGVYETVLKAEGVENVSVEHNIKLQGKSGCEHQIDVYWEFKLAGQVYRTAIECKAYNKEVDIGRIRDFYGVLADVANLNGIFATLVGYQSGAKQYARHYGIALKELRLPTPDDWAGRIKDIVINIYVLISKIKNFQPKARQDFLNSISEPVTGQVGLWTDAPIVFDPDGKPVASYEQLRQSLPTAGAPFKDRKYYAPYPAHRLKLGKLDIEMDGIDFTYDVDVETMTSKVLGEQMAHAIIRDVQTGSYTFVDKQGNVRPPRNHQS
ncbi:restriction endonuclease [Candidatus Binatus sp.]|jgi:hypothetical protein|uniref:restriction endonuclease n=1 Tax=Candidatus Binatus sp. TaxID=2811406 RepID=UPI003C632132